jgi:tRNA pseudouridine55 synthase
MLDGLLVVDKPSGPSSHDVVARMRRVLGERRIGHTGTLDPLATGVLPLVVGRATRLARFISASDKSYEAAVRLGISTDTADAEGTPIGSAFNGSLPSRDDIDRALDAFRGTFLQQPPAFSAKKIGGQRSYELARGSRQLFSTDAGVLQPPLDVDARELARNARQLLSTGAGAPPPARTDPDASRQTATHSRGRLPETTRVTAFEVNLVRFDGDLVTLTIACSSGFYVRSLAHDLGEALGTGAHLEALRRTRSGGFTLSTAMPLDEAEQNRDAARAAVVPLAGMLPELPAVVLTAVGVRHAVHGRELGGGDFVGDLGLGIGDSEDKSQIPNPKSRYVRMLDPAGALVGIARPSKTPGSLHPFVVLM